MPACHRLQLLGHHLASVPTLRIECSLQWAGGRLQIRPKPMFWVGFAHRDSRADFEQLHQLLVALECPPALLDSHRNLSLCSLYQGVVVDINSARTQGTLFMHYRDDAGERRLGLGWDENRVQPTDYRTGRLTIAEERNWLQRHVHLDYQQLLGELLDDARLIDKGGYWVQRKQGQDTELYLTYPWHPSLWSLSQSLSARLLETSPDEWQRYRAVAVRHIGFSCLHNSKPAMTFYISTPYSGSWPCNFEAFEMKVLGS